jgi:hypothetical protein
LPLPMTSLSGQNHFLTQKDFFIFIFYHCCHFWYDDFGSDGICPNVIMIKVTNLRHTYFL